MSEEINEAILEGTSVNNWTPGAWSNPPTSGDEEWQPDIDPPHVNDYAAFKKHKHYGKYFRAYRYIPFPAWMYHAKEEPKLVKSREEVLALGPEWSPTPNKPRIDMTGKSLPVKTETQVLGEVIARTMAAKQQGSGAIDPTAIAAIVAAVMAAIQPVKVTTSDEQTTSDEPDEALTQLALANLADETMERSALLELAEKEGVKIDKRWSNERIKKELGI